VIAHKMNDLMIIEFSSSLIACMELLGKNRIILLKRYNKLCENIRCYGYLNT